MPDETPPAPSVGTQPTASLSATQNPWRAIDTTFTVQAQSARPVHAPRGWSKPVRSRFRRGELMLEEEGIIVRGQQTMPLRWLGWVGLGLGLALMYHDTILGGWVQRWGMTPPQRTAFFYFCLLLGLAVMYGSGAINEWRRGPALFRIVWASVLEVQVHPRLLWLVLVYRGATVSGKKPRAIYLPVSGMSPAKIAALADAVQHYAPGTIRRDARLFDLVAAGRRVLVLLSIASLTMTFTILLWSLLHH